MALSDTEPETPRSALSVLSLHPLPPLGSWRHYKSILPHFGRWLPFVDFFPAQFFYSKRQTETWLTMDLNISTDHLQYCDPAILFFFLKNHFLRMGRNESITIPTCLKWESTGISPRQVKVMLWDEVCSFKKRNKECLWETDQEVSS